MKYVVKSDRIEIEKCDEFDIRQILECGQIFRFYENNGEYSCCSGDRFAKIIESDDKIIILTSDPRYFENFFDLKTDYAAIKKQLSADAFMAKAISYGKGIRILNREPLDCIIEFIISANNNITRIRKIVERLCEGAGTKKSGYYAFPTIDQLADRSLEFYNSLGAGYRGAYLFDTVQRLKLIDISILREMPTQDLKKFLISLKGIGEKVANCILLFGFHRMDTFPVDTWIAKVYADHFGGELTSRVQITRFFEEKYGTLSGIAQQYLFYYKRECLE